MTLDHLTRLPTLPTRVLLRHAGRLIEEIRVSRATLEAERDNEPAFRQLCADGHALDCIQAELERRGAQPIMAQPRRMQ